MKKHIPNFITCLNLFSGCLAVTYAFNGRLDLTACFIAFALIFDFADGFVARMLKVHSELGKQLDSLADVISFGLVPGIVVYHLLLKSMELYYPESENSVHKFLPFYGFIISVFSAIRLAKFNIDTRQSDSFIGLPTPANTMVFVSLPLILQMNNTMLNTVILNPVFLILISTIMSALLIAELPLFALKFKSFSFKENAVKYIYLALSIVLLFVLKYIAVPLIILMYIVISVLINKSKKSEVQS